MFICKSDSDGSDLAYGSSCSRPLNPPFLSCFVRGSTVSLYIGAVVLHWTCSLEIYSCPNTHCVPVCLMPRLSCVLNLHCSRLCCPFHISAAISPHSSFNLFCELYDFFLYPHIVQKFGVIKITKIDSSKSITKKILSSRTVFTLMIIIRNISWAANQHFRMIYEGSCDTEYWSNDAENSALPSQK